MTLPLPQPVPSPITYPAARPSARLVRKRRAAKPVTQGQGLDMPSSIRSPAAERISAPGELNSTRMTNELMKHVIRAIHLDKDP